MLSNCYERVLSLLFASCSNKGYPIPIYEAGTGACSGATYNTTTFLTTNVVEPEPVDPETPAKTLHVWLSDLHKDGLLLTSFIFGLISGKHRCNFKPYHWAADIAAMHT